MSGRKSVLLIDGAGAQGVPIVKALSQDPQFTSIRVLTRDATSANAQLLSSLPRVSLHIGAAEDEASLRSAFKDIDLAFVNLNGSALGIKSETYWGISIFEIAIQSGVKQYIWSVLEYMLRDSGYDEAVRCGHYEGKARVTEWMASQPQTPMQHSVLTTGPYMEMLSELLRPIVDDKGIYIFTVPLADGAVPFIHLDDIANYVVWLFTHPSESAGLNLKVATEHVGFHYLAETFTSVTGKPARYEPVSIDEYFSTGPLAPAVSMKLGAPADDPTLMTTKENFSAWWTMYQRSADNKGLVKRDYELLDRILPTRVKRVGEWMQKVGYTGERRSVVRNYKVE
jgi:uncharacterized protein YbjT (DUF2867 family)